MRSVECERIRGFVRDRNRVLMSFPTASACERVLTGIDAAEAGCREAGHFLSFEATAAELRTLCRRLGDRLSPEEQAEARVLLVPAGYEPTPAQCMSALSVAQMLALIDGIHLVELIEEERLLSALQPIFRADRTPYGHEALLRGRERDGSIISAGDLFAAAAATELLFTVDSIAHRLAFQAAAHTTGAIFVNFNPASIEAPGHRMRDTVGFVHELGLTPGNVVLEVTEGREARDLAHLRRTLGGYREAGFRVALDDVGAGFASLNMLLELQPDIIKIDLDLVRGVDRDRYRQSVVGHLIGIAQDVGALSVAEGIETEGELAWVTEAGVDLLQGFLLGQPYIPPPQARNAGLRSAPTG